MESTPFNKNSSLNNNSLGNAMVVDNIEDIEKSPNDVSSISQSKAKLVGETKNNDNKKQTNSRNLSKLNLNYKIFIRNT